MIEGASNWKTELAQLFSASVNQQSLDEAVEEMVAVSAHDRAYHDEILSILDKSIIAAGSGDDSILAYINETGYHASDVSSALDLLTKFRSLYVDKFKAATS